MNLLDFLDSSPLAFHAARNVASELAASGFRELREADTWKLLPATGYYVSRNGSGIIAFRTPEAFAPAPFLLALTHLDSPGLRFKMTAMHTEAGNLVIPVERYSQNLDSTWLDKPLAIAGRVVTKDGRQLLVHFHTPVAVIPNLATHLLPDRAAPASYNPQTELRALCGDTTPQKMLDAIAQNAGCSTDDILAMELAPVDATPAAIVGIGQDLVNAPRLDNLLAAHAAMTAITETTANKAATAVAGFFDNEEIGSTTPAGANSAFLRDTLERITIAMGLQREDFFRCLAMSRMLSVDAAHALHPNYQQRYDAATAPVINRGVVIKENANGRYTTNAVTMAWLTALCQDADVPLQLFTMRSDQPCGSTVGPMTAARLGIPGVDIGNAMWAMHSVRETAGIKDQDDMIRLIHAFFSHRP